MLVVKLGGSLAGDAHFAAWLDILASAPLPLVIVPGGGPFADAVRAAQAPLRYSDATAHHMALLAMAQFGLAIAAARPRFVVAETEPAIQAALAAGKIPVWNPFAMIMQARDIPASWDVTSDSLAAWLAARLRAKHLLLVKQVDAGQNPASAQDLATRRVTDPCFPAFLAVSGASGFIAGPAALAGAKEIFQKGNIPGKQILPP